MTSPRSHRVRHAWITAVVTLAVAVCAPVGALAQGCAMCRTLIGGPGDPLGYGMNTSILFMMAMPFVLTGSVGAWIAYMYWRGGRGERSGAHPLPSPREEVS